MTEKWTHIRQSIHQDWQIWKDAILWGSAVAIIHRLILQLWATLAWSLLGQPLYGSAYDLQASYGASMLPPLEGMSDLIFGIWRRWDAVHYLRLAQDSYSSANINISVFPPLAPLGFSAINSILPFGIDFAAMFFNTLMFVLALIFLFRICEVHFMSTSLARWSVCLYAMMPLSYVFVAPMAEPVYLAMTLACIYFALQRQWLACALCGFLAAAARSQGAILLCFVGLILLWKEWDSEIDWANNIINVVKKSFILVLIPFGFIAFLIFRNNLGLPDLNELYYANWNTLFVDPLTGLWINLRWFVVNLPDSLARADIFILIGVLVLTPLLIVRKQHRNIIFIGYTVVYLCLFLSVISNYEVNPNMAFTVSLGRYCLTLFPLAILLADMIRTARRRIQIITSCFLVSALLMLTALNTMGLTSA